MEIPYEHWSAIFSSSPNMIVIIDAETYNVLLVSDPLLRVHSKKQEDVTGRPLFEVFPPLPGSDPGASYASFKKVRDTKLPDVQDRVKFDVANPDGSHTERVWISSHYPVIIDGAVKYILIVAEDVTALTFLDGLANSLGAVGDALRSAVDVVLEAKIQVNRDRV